MNSRLRYSSDSEPGIRRVTQGDEFVYLRPDGKPVRKPKDLDRIRTLALPPAYTDVWICADPNGHLQATGKDARGRKQYRYHPDFEAERQEEKFSRMARFGRALPKIRERVTADLRRPGMPKEKVMATLVRLLEKSLIRVGNDEYAQQNKSYGLTTMRNRHARVKGKHVVFRFQGKSGIRHEIDVEDPTLARIVGRLQDLPGQDLFQYLDDDGKPHSVSSSDVNAYLKEISGGPFTAKDFRTWAGTVLTLELLSTAERPEKKTALKRAVNDVVKNVATHLGNTPAVARKAYIHPAVVQAFEGGSLGKIKVESEQATLSLLRKHAQALRAAAASSQP